LAVPTGFEPVSPPCEAGDAPNKQAICLRISMISIPIDPDWSQGTGTKWEQKK